MCEFCLISYHKQFKEFRKIIDGLRREIIDGLLRESKSCCDCLIRTKRNNWICEQRPENKLTHPETQR